MEYAYLSASTLARMIRDEQASAVELLDYFVARQAQVNPSLNAIVVDNHEAARARAEAADKARARGESWGPLHGVPMTVKETFELEGLPTTAGAPALADHISSTTAPAVQRLLNAGAVIYGKTNTPAYAADLQTYNDIYGTTNNPWDLSRTPGGSSGGAAAALAAGLTPLELGSDIGGSIRTPAAFCGVCGHKPSWGIIPTRGHVPGPPGALASRDIGVAGPLARDTDDLELALGLLAGPDESEAAAWRLELPSSRHSRLQDFRVAAWIDDSSYPLEEEIASALQQVMDKLEQAKVGVDRKARPEGISLKRSHDVYYRLLSGIMGSGLPEKSFNRLLEKAGAEESPAGYPVRFAQGATQYHAQWLATHEERMRMRRAWKLFFDRFDIMLCPAVQMLPFQHLQEGAMDQRVLNINGHEEPYLDILLWAGLAGIVYLPATVIPMGLSRDGLPMGIQIIAPYLEDRTALEFAGQLTQLIGGFQRPPMG